MTVNQVMKSITEKYTKLNGWITSVRNANIKTTFANLRLDNNENIQIVLDRSQIEKDHLTPETCVTVEGKMVHRPKSSRLDHQVERYEIQVEKLIVHNRADSPLPLVLHEDQHEDVRLRYRYLDMRRAPLQYNLRFRSQFIHKIRLFFHEHDFLEVETPLLFKSTPEGAEEFLVTGGGNSLTGSFALPQSPQQFKQMLVIGGISKYFQIAKCFRNEDLRTDRQPEFTQLDVEMGFATSIDVKDVVEKCLRYALGEERVEFSEITFDEAISKYGSDKPIIHPLEIEVLKDYGDVIEESLDILENSDIARAFTSDQTLGTITKEIKDNKLYTKRYSKNRSGVTCLGKMRSIMLKRILKADPTHYKFLWVNDFPLFYYEDNGVIKSMHHPFTAPHHDDLNLLSASSSELYRVRGLHYDLVLNGVEVGGGSARIHQSSLQQQIFEILKIDKTPFSHLLEALRYGAPPHAGIALGLDRLLAILSGSKSIRDVIAFPKNSSGRDLLFNSPSLVKNQ